VARHAHSAPQDGFTKALGVVAGVLSFAVVLTQGGLLAFLAGTLLGGLAGTLLHEAAHAAVGRALGLRVDAVEVGAGPPLLRVGGWSVHRRLLDGGRTRFQDPPDEGLPLAVVAAGPVANLLLAVGGLVVGGSFGLAVAILNLVVLVGNLRPAVVGGSVTDGGQVLAALGVGDWRSRTSTAGADAFAAASAQGQQGLTVPALQRHLADRPDDGQARRALAVELSRAGRFADALDQLAQVPGTAGTHEEVDAALGAHLLGQRAGHVEALAAAAQGALVPIGDPARSATAHTLALARLAQGRFDEAYDLARSAWSPDLAPVDAAAVVATAALAATGAGRPEEGHRLGSQVHASAPYCPWLPLLQQWIQQAARQGQVEASGALAR
jgi:hypothetical protein